MIPPPECTIHMCTFKFFSELAGSVCTVEMMEKCALLLILAALVSSRSVFQPLEDKPITWDTNVPPVTIYTLSSSQ